MPPAAIAGIGAGIAAVSAVSSGIAAGNAASYQAQVSRNNQAIAQQNAQRAASATAAQTEAAGLKARAQQGGLRAALAANGVDVNSGSAADVQSGERQIGYLDTATVAGNAAQQVYGYRTQASNFGAQAELDQSEAAFDPIAGGLKAAGGLASAYPGFAGGRGSPAASGQMTAGGYGNGTDFNSLLTGSPSVNNASSWMYSASNPTDEKF